MFRLLFLIIWIGERVDWRDTYKACRDICIHSCHLTKLTIIHDQHCSLIWAATATACYLYQRGSMWPRGPPFCGWAWALSRNSSHNARAWMLRDEGIMMPGSKEASFFRRFYRIPGVDFLLFGWERGLLVHYCILENCGAAASTTVSALACVDYIETNPTTI